MPSTQRSLMCRLLALATVGALSTGCATVPGDPYYYDGGYAAPAPYVYPAPSGAITVYEQPSVIYTSPPPGWRAEAWREQQRRDAREREWRNTREREARERDRQREMERRSHEMREQQQRQREAQRQQFDRQREMGSAARLPDVPRQEYERRREADNHALREAQRQEIERRRDDARRELQQRRQWDR